MRRWEQQRQRDGLHQRLLSTASCRHGQGGYVLLEWTLSSGLGLLLVAAALLLQMHQLKLLKDMARRHWQEQELRAIVNLMRAELSIAGQRDQPGASTAHDRLALESGKTQLVAYLCDRCGSPDRARQSSFRLLDGLMGHRSLGASAHQALHDTAAWSLKPWSWSQGQGDDCSPWIRIDLRPLGDTAGVSFAVRPRNLERLPCEESLRARTGGTTSSTEAVTVAPSTGTRITP